MSSVALPLPWFSHWPTKPPFFTWELFQASVIEIFFYAPFLRQRYFGEDFQANTSLVSRNQKINRKERREHIVIE